MIGAIKMGLMSYSGSGGSPYPPSPLAASPTITNLGLIVPNGTYITPPIGAVVSGGTEPYSYEWTIVGAGMSVLSPDEKTTKVQVSGFNIERSGTLSCTVTDDAADTVTFQTSILIAFGESDYAKIQ
jgi:hypothetical protein